MYFNNPQRKYLLLNMSPAKDGELASAVGVVVLNSKETPTKEVNGFINRFNIAT